MDNKTKNLAEQLAEKMSKGEASFQKDYKAGEIKLATNPANGRTFSSINALSLAEQGEKDPRFMTAKAAHDKGFQVKDDAKASTVYQWQTHEKIAKRDDQNKPITNEITGKAEYSLQKLEAPRLNVVKVYNGKDIEGLNKYKEPTPNLESDKRAMNLVKAYEQDNKSFQAPLKEQYGSQREHMAATIDKIAESEAAKNPKLKTPPERAAVASISAFMMKCDLKLPHEGSKNVEQTKEFAGLAKINPNIVYKAATASQQIKESMAVLSRARLHTQQMDSPESSRNQSAKDTLDQKRSKQLDVGLGRV